MANGHGGARRGGGKPKGVKWPSTLAKEAARELVRLEVTKRMPELIEAQTRHAIGLTHLMLRNEDGTWSKAPAEMTADEMLAVLNGPQERYYLATKDPSTQAFTDLMNRALDKPKEQAADVNLHVTGELAAAIAEGRQRAAARNRKG
jgi:hypothetical protein